MKKINFLIGAAALVITTALISCSGSGTQTTETKTASVTAIEVAPEMQSFMNKLDGRSSSVGAALEEFGMENLVTADMEIYDLKEPVCTGKEGDGTYLLNVRSGMTVRGYKLTWKDKKIVAIVDDGIKN